MTARAVVFACVALQCAALPPAFGGSLLLSNANIVDPAIKQQFVGHVLVEDRKVSAVVREMPADFRGEVVDLAGKFLIPGLIDAHVHSEGNKGPKGEPGEVFWVEETARRMLYAGVTAYLDVGLDPRRIFPVRDRIRRHEAAAADVYAAGPVFIGTRQRVFAGAAESVRSADDARVALDRLMLQHPDVVKIIFDWARGKFSMSEEVMRALIDHAHALGLKTVVHIGTWENARLAALAGADAITHLADTEDLPDDVARLLADKRVVSIPTTAVQQDFLNIVENPGLLDNPLLRGVAGESLIAAYAQLDAVRDAGSFTCRWQRRGRAHYGVSLRRLIRAGVPILAGSDTGNLGTFQGFSLHRELILLNEWGLSNWDTLAAATTRASTWLGLNMGFTAGADATFVVLNENPLIDIANTQSIDRILFHGKWVDRAAIEVTN